MSAMASSNEVSWQSAYYALIPIALNSMLQCREPTGTICGLDPSLRIYLRSSPIVCAMDAAFILIRFPIYVRRHGDIRSLSLAAKEILAARSLVRERLGHEEDGREERRPGRLLNSEFNVYLWYLPIGVGVITQLPKLTAFSGGSGAILWTITWAWLYFGSWFVVEVTYWLARLERDTDLNHPEIKALEDVIAPYEKSCGVLAILVQLGVLAVVDMKAIPPDPDIPLRWFFRGVRFAAHLAVFVVHFSFFLISCKIDAKRVVPSEYMGLLVVFILVPYIVLAAPQDKRYSALYFMVSIMISNFSWMLYFFPWTKQCFLFCEPSGRVELRNRGEAQSRRGVLEIRLPRRGGESENKGWQNVLAFDFFLRIVLFSAYWYIVHYDPTGTIKPPWTNNLG